MKNHVLRMMVLYLYFIKLNCSYEENYHCKSDCNLLWYLHKSIWFNLLWYLHNSIWVLCKYFSRSITSIQLPTNELINNEVSFNAFKQSTHTQTHMDTIILLKKYNKCTRTHLWYCYLLDAVAITKSNNYYTNFFILHNYK